MPAYALTDPHAVCRRCNTALEYAPDHPGAEDGDWWTHPNPAAIRNELGHTTAFMRRHPELGTR